MMYYSVINNKIIFTTYSKEKINALLIEFKEDRVSLCMKSFGEIYEDDFIITINDKYYDFFSKFVKKNQVIKYDNDYCELSIFRKKESIHFKFNKKSIISVNGVSVRDKDFINKSRSLVHNFLEEQAQEKSRHKGFLKKFKK